MQHSFVEEIIHCWCFLKVMTRACKYLTAEDFVCSGDPFTEAVRLLKDSHKKCPKRNPTKQTSEGNEEDEEENIIEADHSDYDVETFSTSLERCPQTVDLVLAICRVVLMVCDHKNDDVLLGTRFQHDLSEFKKEILNLVKLRFEITLDIDTNRFLKTVFSRQFLDYEGKAYFVNVVREAVDIKDVVKVSSQTCSICLEEEITEEGNFVMLVPCKHVYCLTCCKTWFHQK